MENKESFVDLYVKLYNENFNELEALRRIDRAKRIKIPATLVAIVMLFTKYWLISACIMVILIVSEVKCIVERIRTNGGTLRKYIKNREGVAINSFNNERLYNRVYKERIILPIIKNVFPEVVYSPGLGMKKGSYVRGQWERFDKYESEDRIVANTNFRNVKGNNLKLIIAEVHTQSLRTDKNGHVSYFTVFHGLAGNIYLSKPIGCYIKVVKDMLDLMSVPKDKIKMDMTEFEKIFDVKTNDKIKANQVLTSDVMIEMIELVNISGLKFEIYINNDIMHVRFHTGSIFEPNKFGKSMQLEKLKTYFDIVTSVKKLTEKLCNAINELEI